ncbi:D-2-hydroxyacid dehydrogenase [Pseudactinotalea sp. HY158]|uniref:D-2-hydroxyacid dehydrogenase n=1 Tax=Pseudactinotalea sp. HY158 TaxID=2654547 RepID=UPI00129D0807|nr:D-2-hydroxyacid dehydrogenase [Pseudactinotalea sp. HY158]QGH68516.1 D-2-hydroxyacid dehydrogenase [Pseudactinotalea sp. HY158]
MSQTTNLRVVVATDLPRELCTLISELEPRCEVVCDHELYRPMQVAADWSGDPNHIRSTNEQERFERMVDSADALFSLPDVDPTALARTVAANPRLRWVHTTAAGGGSQVRAANLDSEALERITFTTSAGVHGDYLAEFALFGLLAGVKDLRRLLDQQADSHWSSRWEMRQLADLTVLVLGLGGIGTAVARRLAGLGVTVWGTTRTDAAVDGVSRLVRPEDVEAVMSDVDAIVATLPGTDQTEKFVDAAILGAARPGLIVTNVGRGSVIDEDALIDALNSGQVGFAALDVFAVEPLPVESPLWSHPNVLVSPHTAALNNSEEERIARLFADNATRLIEGRDLRNVVDTVEFY